MPLAPVEWTCMAFAIVVAHLFLYHEWNYPSAYDATTYVDIGHDIAEGGHFRNFSWSDRRTYGYPFVLSLVVPAASATGVPLLVLLLQLLAYLAAVMCLRHAEWIRDQSAQIREARGTPNGPVVAVEPST